MTLYPVRFLIGDDPLQRRLFLEELKTELFPNGSGGLNDDTLDLKERKLAEVLDLANTLPMLAPRRLIVLHNAGNPNEHDQELWARYLENPSPQTVLVAVADKLDKRTRFSKMLAKSGVVTAFDAPKPRDLPIWIDRLSKRHDVTLSGDARSALAESVGTDLSAIDSHLEKLALYVYPKKTVDRPDVDRLVLQTTGDNIFAWTDHVIEGRRADAVNTLYHLLDEGTPPLVLVTMLARHVRLLLRTHQHLAAKTARGSLASALGLPPFVVERYVQQSRRTSTERLRHSLARLRSLDRDLKSTGLPAHLLLEETVRTF